MKYNKLGKTRIEVSQLGMGGLFVANFAVEKPDGVRTIKRAAELGINYIDTAPNYFDSEIVIGEAIREIGKPLIISTKIGGGMDGFDPKEKDCIKKSVEKSLKRFGRDYLDILFIHEPDRPELYDWWNGAEDFTGAALDVIKDYKRQGVVKNIGVAGTTPYRLARIMKTGEYDVVLTAFNYCPLYREAAYDILPTAKALNMGVVAGSPLRQGYFATRYDDLIKSEPYWMSKPRRDQFLAFYELLDDIKMNIAEFSMRFILSNKDIHSVITGSRSTKEIELNVAAIEKGELPANVLERIEEIYQAVPFPPQEEPFIMPFGGIYEKREGEKE